MSLLTLIDNIPLYSTIEEAEAWGSSFGIQGHHIHIYQGQTGYMPGASHEDIELSLSILGIDLTNVEGIESIIISTQQTPPPPQIPVTEVLPEETPISTVEDFESQETQPIVQPTTTTTTTTSGGSSGGGGGGGGGY